ncbi:MAG: sigma-54-dependent Fis family transcriptional regulator [Chitinophagales bacterium]|nr:sigma-54-dependent Fis family transcriptional regulator [Chitinophagales bacterium]
MARLLIIDDDVDICSLLTRFLLKHGYEVEAVHAGNRGLEKLAEHAFDLVLCDFRLQDTDGRELLKKIKSLYPKTSVIIITGYSDIKVAVEVMKLGAFDYVTKPLIPAEVLGLIQKALEIQEDPESKKSAVAVQVEEEADVNQEQEFMRSHRSESRSLYNQVEVVAPTNYSVILYGESGTGKEVIAQTIHNFSSRRDQPFVAMDCGALTRELAGSELFGHEKGAFTGAVNSKAGHFEMANGGTLFLDEVSNLPYDIQVALLRVIQERKFRRLGGMKEITVDVRIIVASNENLHDAYKKGKFREDLYHRFNEFSIYIPPLRMRKDDIMDFANFFLEKANRELEKLVEGFEKSVMEIFMNYYWPGNLRELRNIVRRAALLTDGGKVQVSALPFELENYRLSSNYPNNSLDRPNSETDLKAAAHEAEYETIRRVLEKVNYNKTKAARILNIDRKTLYNKIKNFNL